MPSNHERRSTSSGWEETPLAPPESNTKYLDLDSSDEDSRDSADIVEQLNISSPSQTKCAADVKPGTDQYQQSRDLTLETKCAAHTVRQSDDNGGELEKPQKKPMVSWNSLPRKGQLFILILARLSEPLTQTSLGSYVYYQLQSFDRSLPDSTISYQAGVIHASFPAAQFLTAVLWGRFADSAHGGRKRVIWIGLMGTLFSMIGYGFSRSFPVAVAFRIFGGVLNGNIGVMRTMISETIKEKKYQAKAFTIMPICFNVGVILGPILGGILADPVGSYPSIFGPDSLIGRKDGVQWMMKWPYALPNLMSAVFLFFSMCCVIFFLEETGELRKDKTDFGLIMGRWIRRHVFRQKSEKGYQALHSDEEASVELLHPPKESSIEPPSRPLSLLDPPPIRRKLAFRRIWTRNLNLTLFSHGILSLHVGTFNSLWFIYLSAPRFDPANPQPPGFRPHGLIRFTGGLALPPPRIGLALAILGVIGITLQLSLYPWLTHRLGTIKCFTTFLILFPVAYTVVPYLSLVPSTTEAPGCVTGPLIWICIAGFLFIHTLARTFALPCSTILINNACPHPSVLGTVHGIGQSASSLARTIGPIIFGWVFGKGLDIGAVVLAWWILAVFAVAGSIAARFLWEGDGHEILLEGEVKE